MLDVIKRLFPQTDPSLIDRFAALQQKMAAAQINTPQRQAAFLSQVGYESDGFGDRDLEENLNYSAERLRVVFGKYFTNFQSLSYANRPEMIANRVYANRIGNGPESSGDGFRYRGRGLIQLTGKDNYARCSKDIGVDLISNPDYAATITGALDTSIWYWTKNNCNQIADTENIKLLTATINGGFNGLTQREALYSAFLQQLRGNTSIAPSDTQTITTEKLNQLSLESAKRQNSKRKSNT